MRKTTASTSAPKYGALDPRGHWKPPYPAAYAPLFVWPPQIKALLTFLFGFPGLIWPFNLALVTMLGIMIAFPELATYLPKFMK